MKLYGMVGIPGEEPEDIVLPWNHLQRPLPQSILIKHLADATSYFNLPQKELQPLGESFI